MEDKCSKSTEEREEEYHKARERIFNQDVSFSILISASFEHNFTHARATSYTCTRLQLSSLHNLRILTVSFSLKKGNMPETSVFKALLTLDIYYNIDPTTYTITIVTHH